jgi:hypothetical protein
MYGDPNISDASNFQPFGFLSRSQTVFGNAGTGETLFRE